VPAPSKPRTSPTPRPISRFIVMAMLQAARAKQLGLSLDSAYSWGLNRAIFYAAAKRGFKGGEGGSGSGTPAGGHPNREAYQLGQDFAFRDTTRTKLYFTIGDDTQTEKEFEQQIERRFVSRPTFERAWREAEEIVGAAERASLESGAEFYSRIYRPRRDGLAARWTGYLPDH
jgi:hypothetical protein